MRERKFIIVKNDKSVIRVGYVLYHRDLLNKGERDNIVCGGGKWDIYPEEKKIIFWGSSDDYGKYNINDVKEALKNMNAHDWFMFEWIASRSYANDYSELDFDHLNTFDIDIK